MCTCGSTRDDLPDDLRDGSVFFRTCVAAVRDHTTAARLRHRAMLGDTLLGEGAGTRHAAHAQRSDLAASTGFARARRLLSTIQDSDLQDEIAESVTEDRITRLLDVARTTALTMLVDSGCTPEDARGGIDRFDSLAYDIRRLTSPTAVFDYLDQRLARLSTATARSSADEPTAFCILILLFSSLYYLILISALLTGNAARWFPIMVNQVCRDLAS